MKFEKGKWISTRWSFSSVPGGEGTVARFIVRCRNFMWAKRGRIVSVDLKRLLTKCHGEAVCEGSRTSVKVNGVLRVELKGGGPNL